MAIHIVKRIAQLGEEFVLAPERFDPRRAAQLAAGKRLSEVAELVSIHVAPRALPVSRPVLVLDTTHALEGFVLATKEPQQHVAIRSGKRLLSPGDVIVSRLRPYLRQIAYVDEGLFQWAACGNEVVASSEFFVLRGRAPFDAACLVPFLLSEPVQAVLAAGQEGGHHPRFSRELLLSLCIPEQLLLHASATAQRVREQAQALRTSLRARRALVQDVERMLAADAPG